MFLVRALGEEPDDVSDPLFVGVPRKQLFYGYIQRFAQLGISGGCSGTDFCPERIDRIAR